MGAIVATKVEVIDEQADRIFQLKTAIAKHRDTSLRYGISRSIDRELWEVLDHE